MVTIITAVLAVIIYTNTTLRSIEKNLPNTLLTELNMLSVVLEKISAVVSSSHIARATPKYQQINQLQTNVTSAYNSIVDLRDTYVTNNLINASELHAVIAPAIADLQIWLSEGVSGYQPDSDITLSIIETRISTAFEKASLLKFNSQVQAQSILDKQRRRLESFLSGVNLLFVLTLLIVSSLIFMLIRQTISRNREIAIKNELREQHYLLESLLQNLPLGITVWDQDKTIAILNKSFMSITGYDKNDLPHLKIWGQLAYPDTSYRQLARQHWKKIVQHKGVGEYKIRCKNGETKDVEFQNTFLPDGRVINTLTDVTSRNINARALQ